MNTRRTLRLLSPLLAAFVVACNINESSNEAATKPVPESGLVAFTPRLTAVGRLQQSDSVYLKLWMRKTSADTWDSTRYFKKLWSDSSVHVDSLPVGRLWKVEIVGVTDGDTLWRGTDSGSVSKNPYSRNLSDSASGVLVKNLASRPQTTSLPDSSLTAGQSIVLPMSGKIAHSWGASLPDCNGSDTSKTIQVDSLHSKLSLQACGDSTTWPSAVVSWQFKLKGIALPILDFPQSLRSTASSTAPKLAWDSAIVVNHPTGTSVQWTLKTGTTSIASGTSDSLKVPATFIASLAPTDSLLAVQVLISLKDSTGKTVDTATLAWIQRIPVTPIPRLSHRFSAKYDSVAFSWSPVDSSLITVTLPKTTVINKNAAKDTSFATPADTGTTVIATLVAYSAQTGRASAPAMDTVMVPRPASKPGFTAVNFDSLLGRVRVALDAATLQQSNTTWQIASIAASQPIGDMAFKTLASSGIDTLELNSGKWRIGIRALRDGVYRDSLCTLTVVRTKAARPSAPTGLQLVSRTDTTLQWTWNTVPGRKYRIFAASSFSDNDSLSLEPPSIKPTADSLSTGSYLLTTTANKSWYLAVVALQGSTDSTGGNSPPSLSIGTTRNPPSAAQFTATATNAATGEVTVQVTNLAGLTGKIAWRAVGTTLFNWDTLTSSTWSRTGLEGNYEVKVALFRDSLQRDSLLSAPVAVRFTNNHQPLPVSGLTLSSRDSSKITWTWDTQTGHSYRVYHGPGNTITDPLDNAAKTDAAKNGTFTLSGLNNGQSAWIAVTATATDSTKSASNPVSFVSKTLNPPPAITGASVVAGDGSLIWTYDRIEGVEYAISYLKQYDNNTATRRSASSPDTQIVTAGRYITCGLTATRDGYSKSWSTSGSITVTTPSKYAHAAPTGLISSAELKIGTGDTALNFSWAARTGVSFQLTVTPRNTGSAQVFTTSATLQKVLVTPGETYDANLIILGSTDSALNSNPAALTVSTRMAPSPLAPATAVWDKATQSIKVTWNRDTSAATYTLSDDSAFFTTQTIPNTWKATGSTPMASIQVSNPALRGGNFKLHLNAVGNNGLSATEGSISGHIAQQIALTGEPGVNWTSDGFVHYRGLNNMFTIQPDTTAIYQSIIGMSSYDDTTIVSGSSRADVQILLGVSGGRIWPSIQGRWKNGDTTLLSDPHATKDSIYVVGTFGSEASLTKQVNAITVTENAAGNWNVQAPSSAQVSGATSYMYCYKLKGGAWTPLVLGAAIGYQSNVDSVGVRIYRHRQNAVDPALNDTSLIFGLPAIPNMLLDERGTAAQTYKLMTKNGVTWMADPLKFSNLAAPPKTTYGTCLNDLAANCTSDGRLYNWFELTGKTYAEMQSVKDAEVNYTKLQGLCPTNFHIPTQSELTAFLRAFDPAWEGTAVLDLMRKAGFVHSGYSWHNGKENDEQELWTASWKLTGPIFFYADLVGNAIQGYGSLPPADSFKMTVHCVKN